MFFTSSRSKITTGFKIDDLIVFSLDKEYLQYLIDSTGGDIIQLGYSETDYHLILRQVNIENVRLGMRIIENASNHRDKSILDGFTAKRALKDIKQIEMNLNKLKWEREEE